MCKNYLITVLLLNLHYCLAQSMRQADQLFEATQYAEAAQAYERNFEKIENSDPDRLKRGGDAHYFINNSASAYKWYHKLYMREGEAMQKEYLFRYIQSLKAIEDYTEADRLTALYLKRYEDPIELDRFIEQKKALKTLNEAPSGYKLYNISINSVNSDFAPAFYGDELVYSSSKRTAEVKDKLYARNQQPFLNLYIADRTGDNGNVSNERLFMKELPSKYHDATVAFSKNLDTIYYTTNGNAKNRSSSGADKINNFHIMRSIIRAGKIVETKALYFNSNEYSVGHPALSDDGKYLYFVSDMPGGYGETDIYRVPVTRGDYPIAPQNLGPTVNTSQREMFPYYRDKHLYFSSDGHYGLGGLDVFETKDLGSLNYSIPRNLGKPVNSNQDDFSFILAENLNEGYMASNRSIGVGDDDIYYFKKFCNQVITGTVVDSLSRTPIANAMIQLSDQYGNEINTLNSDSNGKYTFTVGCDNSFQLTAKKADFTQEIRKINVNELADAGPIKVDFLLTSYKVFVAAEGKEEKIKIEPLFFELDKFEITPQAATQLDQVVYVMRKFPDLKIKIESHTDSRGSDNYNLKLSQKRAESTKAYILSKGIAENRILSAKGYGEIDIQNKCTNGVECTDAEHEQNRRSNFLIVNN